MRGKVKERSTTQDWSSRMPPSAFSDLSFLQLLGSLSSAFTRCLPPPPFVVQTVLCVVPHCRITVKSPASLSCSEKSLCIKSTVVLLQADGPQQTQSGFKSSHGKNFKITTDHCLNLICSYILCTVLMTRYQNSNPPQIFTLV